MKSFSTLYILMLIKQMKKSQKLHGFCYKHSRMARRELFPASGDLIGVTHTDTLMPRQDCQLGNGPGKVQNSVSTAIIRHITIQDAPIASMSNSRRTEMVHLKPSKFPILHLLFSVDWKMPACLGGGDLRNSVSQFKC